MLLKKFFNVGFKAIAVVARRPFGFADLSRYPLFAPEFLECVRQVLPPQRHYELVRSITITAHKPSRRRATDVPRPYTLNLSALEEEL